MSQNSEELLIIDLPTIEQEATSIWRTINDINFFESQGYTINLPEHELIDSLIQKSKNGGFGNDDYSSIYAMLEAGVYRAEDYEKALEKITDQQELLNALIQKLANAKNEWKWDFKLYESYEVVLTLYGTGGGYDPETGRITLLTKPEGSFMKYQNPANTLIHEIVHLGIEQSIIQAYGVEHVLKEKIVDSMVYILFHESLPAYKIQNMGATEIDELLKEEADLNQLASLVAQIARDK